MVCCNVPRFLSKWNAHALERFRRRPSDECRFFPDAGTAAHHLPSFRLSSKEAIGFRSSSVASPKIFRLTSRSWHKCSGISSCLSSGLLTGCQHLLLSACSSFKSTVEVSSSVLTDWKPPALYSLSNFPSVYHLPLNNSPRTDHFRRSLIYQPKWCWLLFMDCEFSAQHQYRFFRSEIRRSESLTGWVLNDTFLFLGPKSLFFHVSVPFIDEMIIFIGASTGLLNQFSSSRSVEYKSLPGSIMVSNQIQYHSFSQARFNDFRGIRGIFICIFEFVFHFIGLFNGLLKSIYRSITSSCSLIHFDFKM
jgi:hypothetical protein